MSGTAHDAILLAMTTRKLLLLDVGWPQAGLLILSLRRAGFDIIRAVPGAIDHKGMGHYCLQCSAPDDFNTAFLKDLFPQYAEADVILPLTEEILDQVWQLPEPMLGRVFPQTDTVQRELLRDRRAMYRMAVAQGVPVPPSVDLNADEDVDAAFNALGSPLVLRGTAGVGGKQVRIAGTRDDAIRELQDLRRVSPGVPFAQRMIPGRRYLFGALIDKGRLLGHYAQTTVEGVRPPTGPSIRVRTLDSPVLLSHGRLLFSALRWSGLACAEFVEDSDGTLYFMEINPRPWAAISAAHASGVPLMDWFAEYLFSGRTDFPEVVAVPSDVPLFPQYASHKILRYSPFRTGDISPFVRCLASAPWSEPRMMLHYMRTLWWQR